MKNKLYLAIAAFTVTGVTFIIGLMLIFNSSALGHRAANNFLRHQLGGSVYTGQFLIIIEGSIASYNTGGFVLSLIGGLGILLSGYAVYKNIEVKEIL